MKAANILICCIPRSMCRRSAGGRLARIYRRRTGPWCCWCKTVTRPSSGCPPVAAVPHVRTASLARVRDDVRSFER